MTPPDYIDDGLQQVRMIGFNEGIDFVLSNMREDMLICIRVAIEWRDRPATEELVEQIFQEGCKQAANRHFELALKPD